MVCVALRMALLTVALVFANEASAQSTRPPSPQPRPVAMPAQNTAPVSPNAITSTVTLGDLGFINGFRFANLGGRREVFLPFPQGADIAATELALVIDDVTAHEAKRSLEILINDRSISAVALDGRGAVRTIRVPLANAKPRDGFLKLSFLYSGAATPDRCIDVRYVGDSVTIRPDTAVSIAISFPGMPDVATTAALLPREVAIVLPRRRLAAADLATALTVARALAASGRQTTFHYGLEAIPDLLKRADAKAWSRGLVVVGSIEDASSYIESPIATIAGATPAFGALMAVRIGGLPALLVSDANAVRAGRLIGRPTMNATRGVTAASVGAVASPNMPTSQISFEHLGLGAQAEVYGRADLPVVVDSRTLPANTRMSRLMLDIMVAPDGTPEKAVISAFVNERLLASTIAASGEVTRLDLALPEGLVGTVADVRAVVQRRMAQGDCRFDPQGFPVQILGSSVVFLEPAPAKPSDFSDLVPRWANGIEVLIAGNAADDPVAMLKLLVGVLDALAPETAPITVRLTSGNTGPIPQGPFLAVSDASPGGTPRVRFDRGRIAVTDRGGRILLDIGGFSAGAVAQVINAGDHPGLWVRGLGSNGALPSPVSLKLDRGDVAFLDQAGVALVMSTERDTLVRVTYPDQVSWVTVADRFRSWIIGTIWVIATIGFLFVLQRMLRRRKAAASE